MMSVMRTMHTTLALLVLYAFISSCRKPVVGCTDSTYGNFNPDANEDDGCCCTITYGPNDRTPVELDQFAVAVPNVPDTITPMPMIELEARAFRMDQSATGPCGCLTSYWLGGLYNQPYASHYGHAAMRSICETQFYWYGKFLPYPTDTAVWNAVAAANGVDSWPALRIQYRMSFTGSGGSGLTMHLVDTLTAHGFLSASTAFRSWGSQEPNRYASVVLSSDLLPCAQYPIDSTSVTIDSLSLSFIP